MANQTYVLNGPIEFTFPFTVRDKTELTLEVVPGSVVPPSEYTLSGAGPNSTSVIIRWPNAPRTGGFQLRITRRVPAERVTFFANSVGVTAADLNDEFNNVYQILQDASDLIDGFQAQLDDVLPDVAAAVAAAEGFRDQAEGFASDANDSQIQAGTFAIAANTARQGAEAAELNTEGFRDAAEGFRDEAETFRNQAEGFKDDAEGAASGVAADADRAENAADAAEGFRDAAEGFASDANDSQIQAGTFATNANTSRIAAENAAIAAEGFRDEAEAAAEAAGLALEEFGDRYYGPLAGDPAERPSGAPSEVGDLYYNTSTDGFRVFDGGNWVAFGGTGTVTEVSGGDGLNGVVTTTGSLSVDSTVVRTSREILAGAGLDGGGDLSSNVILNVDNTVVRTTRQVNTGDGLDGGGNLAANRTLSVDSTVVRTSRTLTAGTGITGGGNLSGDRSFSVTFATLAQAQQGSLFTVVMSPGRVRDMLRSAGSNTAPLGAFRVRCAFTSTGALLAGSNALNVSSVSRSATGRYQVNYAASLGTADYCCHYTNTSNLTGFNSTNRVFSESRVPTATSITLEAVQSSGGNEDGARHFYSVTR